MKFTADITVMPLKELLDPQGKAVANSLQNLGIAQVRDVRIGRHVVLNLDAADAINANDIAHDACKRLLANQVMESFAITISEGI